MPNLSNKLSSRAAKAHRHAVSLSHATREFHTYLERVAKGKCSPKARKGPKHEAKAIQKANHQFTFNEHEAELNFLDRQERKSRKVAPQHPRPIRTLADI